MFELSLFGVVVWMTVVAARIENRSAVLWGAAAVVVCVGTMAWMAMPFVRVLVAAAICLAAMFAIKLITER